MNARKIVDPKRTNQISLGSFDEYTVRRLGRKGKNQDCTVNPENSYEGHLEDQLHNETHKENLTSRWLSIWRKERDSNLMVLRMENQTKEPFQSSDMDTKQSTSDEKGVTGLANMRNTCYMNAALQALRHNTEISAFFLEKKYEHWITKKEASPKVELVKGYADLLRSLWSGSHPSYIRPAGFLQTMIPAANAAGFDQFQIPMQHDSHEFLTFLLDQLHEGMAEEVSIEIQRPSPQSDREKAIQSALEAWKRIFSKQYSPFTEMIYGLLRITYTCKNCTKHWDTFETFNCLKVPIPKPSGTVPSMEELLDSELKEEEVEGFTCEGCKVRGTILRKPRIWRLPRMILLVLKRFTPDGRKIHTAISFPKSNSLTFTSIFSPDSPEPSQRQPYECFATIDHHGIAGGGHYTAQAKSPLSDKWHMFDDETVSSIGEPRFGEHTYIVFLKPQTQQQSSGGDETGSYAPSG
jgi:ubiquitin C-terminal hydrolase